MAKATYIEHNGTVRSVEVDDGISLMEAALANLIPGIDGDCGGAAACATCHVHVAEEWLDKLPAMEPLEHSMLDMAAGSDHRSRLACQLKMCTKLDGIVVRTPLGQH
ncbi:2Fe-2S iron-sulfur cluster-binding protein [Nevskia sp.]|uniref:2Fe-2S iron-sulfur cluster-binding protein n=1 Tax=Nevskia sp. TaxID=1929292 RepID=UPI003F6EC455